MGVGGIAGKYIGDRVEPTSLPQTVAAFHSLVGIAASAAAVGDYANAPVATELDKVHLASIYLATVIGSVTVSNAIRLPPIYSHTHLLTHTITLLVQSALVPWLHLESLMDACLVLQWPILLVIKSIWV